MVIEVEDLCEDPDGCANPGIYICAGCGGFFCGTHSAKYGTVILCDQCSIQYVKPDESEG